MHVAEIQKIASGPRKYHTKMRDARRCIVWKEMFTYSIDGKKTGEYLESLPPSDRHTCSMCGKMCAMRTTNKIISGETVEIIKLHLCGVTASLLVA